MNNKKELPQPTGIAWVLTAIIGLVGLFIVCGAISVVLGGLFTFFWNMVGFTIKFTWLQATWLFMAFGMVSVQFTAFKNLFEKLANGPEKLDSVETEEELED